MPAPNTRFVEAKRLNEMNRLGDLGRFPLPVLLGATLNVLLTVGVVWHYEPITDPHFMAMEMWIGGVLVLNLLPVVLLRLFTLGPDTEYPVIERMNFFGDQHKFSNWVYLAASANMAFWIMVVWHTSYYCHMHNYIAGVMLSACVVTLFPAWIRLFLRLN